MFHFLAMPVFLSVVNSIATLRRHLFRLFACLSLMFVLQACGADKGSPEQQIRQVLAAMEQAAQDRSTDGVMEHISDTYSDHLGNSKKQARQLITFQVLRNQTISIFTLIRSINISGESAEVELSVATAGRESDLSDEAQRLSADVFRLSLLMQKSDSQWQIVSASWKRGW